MGRVFLPLFLASALCIRIQSPLFDGTLNARSLHSTDHRFAMTCSGRDDRVGEFFSELRFVLDIEIVVALLPEMLGLTDQSPRYSLLPRKGLSGPRFKSPP